MSNQNPFVKALLGEGATPSPDSPFNELRENLKREAIKQRVESLTGYGEAIHGARAAAEFLANTQNPLRDPNLKDVDGAPIPTDIRDLPSFMPHEAREAAQSREAEALRIARERSAGSPLITNFNSLNRFIPANELRDVGTPDGKKSAIDESRNSLIGRMLYGGRYNDGNDTVRNNINLVGTIVEAFPRYAGAVITAIPQMLQNRQFDSLSDEHKAIAAKHLAGIPLSPEEVDILDMARVGEPKNSITPIPGNHGLTLEGLLGTSEEDTRPTLKEFVAEFRDSNKRIQDTRDFFDLNISEKTKQDQIASRLYNAYKDDNSNFITLIAEVAKAGADNPQGVLQVLGDMAPDIATMFLSPGAGLSINALNAVGESFGSIAEALNKRLENGEEISAKEISKLLNEYSKGSAAVELLGDVVLRGAARAATAPFSRGVQETASATLGESLVRGLGNAASRTVGAIAGGAVSEGVVEGVTDLIDQRAEQGSWDNVDGARAYTAAGLGALAGGGIPAGGRMARTAQMVGNAAIALSRDADEAPTDVNADAQPTTENGPTNTPNTFPVDGDLTEREAYVDSLLVQPDNLPTEVDVTAESLDHLVDPAQETYNPIKAASVYFRRLGSNIINEEQARAGIYEVADRVAADYEVARQEYETASSEGQQRIQQEIETNEARLASDTLSPNARADIEAHLETLRSQVMEVTPEEQEAAKAKLDKLSWYNDVMQTYRTYADPAPETESAPIQSAMDAEGNMATPMRVAPEASERVQAALSTTSQEVGNRIDLEGLQTRLNENSAQPSKETAKVANSVLTARDIKRNEVRGLSRAYSEAVATNTPVRVTIDTKGNVKKSDKGNIVIDPSDGNVTARIDAARNTLNALEGLAETANTQLKSLRGSTGVTQSSRQYSKQPERQAPTADNTGNRPKLRAPVEEVDSSFVKAKRALDANNAEAVKQSEADLMALASDAVNASPEALQEAFDTLGDIHTPETLNRFTDAVMASYDQADPSTLPKGAYPRLMDMVDNAEARIRERPEITSIRDIGPDRSITQIHDDLVDELDTLSSEDNPEQFKRFIDSAFAINKPSLAKRAMDTLNTVDANSLPTERIEQIVANNQNVQQHYDQALQAFNERAGVGFVEDEVGTNKGLYKHVNGDPSSTLSLFKSPNRDPDNAARDTLKQVHRKDLPLSRINNFMTTLFEGRAARIRELFPKDFLDKITNGGPEKLAAVNRSITTFKHFHTHFKEALIDNLVDIDFENDSRSTNPLEYFYIKREFADGTTGWYLDENLITAMAASAWDEITSNANNAVKSDDKIAAMAGLNESDIILKEVRMALSPFEAAPSDIANNIGTKAVQSLGITDLNKTDRLEYLLPKLRTAIGLTTLNVLQDMGIIQVKTVSYPDVNGKVTRDAKGNLVYPTVKGTFAGFTRTKAKNGGMGNLTANVQKLVDSAKGSSQAVNALIGMESRQTTPSFKPVKPASINPATGKKHPPSMMKVLNRLSNAPITIRNDLLDILKGFPEDIREGIFGVDFRTEESVHINLMPGIEGKNADIRKKWDDIVDFLEGVPADQEMYLTNVVWNQQRVGYTQNVLDPQQDALIARPLMAFKAWEATYDPSNPQDELTFLIALGEAVGIKADTQNAEEVKKVFQAEISKPVVQAALNALKKKVNDPEYMFDPNEEVAIYRATTKEGLGDKVNSLMALLEYAKYDIAKERGETFTTTIPASVDGKSNGQILSTLFYATRSEANIAETLEIMKRGGFFTDEELKDFASFLDTPDASDYYENTAKNMVSAMEESIEIREASLKVLKDPRATKRAKDEARYNLNQHKTTRKGKNLIEFTLGKFVDEATGNVTKVGRDLAKPPTLSTAFGASGKRAAMTLAETFEEKMFQHLENLAVNNDTVGIRKYVQAINNFVLSKQSNVKKGEELYVFPNPNTLDASNILRTPVSAFGLQLLRDAVFDEIGLPTARYIRKTNEMFDKRTNSFNDTITSMYSIFQGVHDAMREQKVEEAVNSGNLPIREYTSAKTNTTNRYLKFGLSGLDAQELDTALEPFKPYINSAFTSENNDPINTGLLMVAQKRNRDTAARVNVRKKGKDGKVKGTTGYADVPQYEPIGVSTSYPIHSLDNFLSLSTLNNHIGLNMHDSVEVNSKELVAASKEINGLTAEMGIKYSPLQNVFQGLRRQLMELQAIDDPVLKEEAVQNIANTMLEYLGDNSNRYFKALNTTYNVRGLARIADGTPVLETVLRQLMTNLYNADRNRLNFMKQVKNVSQYATVDGFFAMSPKLQEEIQNQLNRLEEIKLEFEGLINSDIIREIDNRISGNTITDLVEEAVEANTETVVDDPDIGELEAREASYERARAFLSIKGRSFNQAILDSLQASLTPSLTALLDGFTPDGKTSLNDHLNNIKAPEEAFVNIATAAMDVIDLEYGLNPDVLGEGVVKDNPALVEVLNHGVSSVPAKDVIAVMKKSLGKGNPYRVLLEAIEQAVSPNLRMQMITPLNGAFYQDREGYSGARGWYQKDSKGHEVIYLRSSDYLNGGINQELVMHELLHAALGVTIDEAIRRSNAVEKAGIPTKDYLVLEIRKLEDIRQRAERQLGEQFPEAFTNIHEFVTWGMTNADFIQALQTVRITRNDRAGDSSIVSLSKRFRDVLFNAFKAFFKNSKWGKQQDPNVRTAFDHVIDGTARLFKAAEIRRKNPGQFRNTGLDDITLFMLPESPVTQNLGNSTLRAMNASLRDAALSGVRGEALTKLVGDLESAVYQGEVSTPQEIEERAYEALNQPVPVFVSSLQNSPYQMDAQTRNAAEVVEATLQEALADNPQFGSTRAVNSAKALYDHANEVLTPRDFLNGDWDTATPDERAIAEQKHQFLLRDAGATQGSVNSLARFLTLAATSQEVQDVLATLPPTRTGDDAEVPIHTKAIQLIEQTGEWLSGGLNEATSLGPKATAERVIRKLDDIKLKQASLASKSNTSVMGAIEGSWSEGYENFRKALSERIRKAPNTTRLGSFTKDALTIMDAIANGKGLVIKNAVQRYRDRMFNDQNGLLANTAQYISGYGATLTGLMRQVKQIERFKQESAATVAGLVNNAFEGGGTYLTPELRRGVTNTVLRTDLKALRGTRTLQDMEALISNNSYRAEEIDRLSKEVVQRFKKHKTSLYVNVYAEGLGRFMATGKTNLPMLPLNVQNLLARAYKKGVYGWETNIPQADIDLLEELVTLHAISHTSTEDRQNAIEVLRQEANRTDGNSGIQTLLDTHTLVERESDLNFTGSASKLKMKGYLPEITNPNIEMVFVELEDVTAKKLEGYELVEEITPSTTVAKHVSNARPRAIMIRRGSKVDDRVSGIIPLVDNQIKGTNVLSDTLDLTNPTEADAFKEIPADFMKKLYAISQGTLTPDPAASEPVPFYNQNGKLSGFRYMMSSHLRDTALERNNDFADLIGRMSGNTYDKSVSMKLAQNMVKEMVEDYRENGKKEPYSYLIASPDSANKEMRELYSRLPEEIQRNYKEIPVRKNLVDILLGYKKFSVAHSFLKDPSERKGFEKHMVGIFEHFFKGYATSVRGMTPAQAEHFTRRLAPLVVKGERAWKEIAREIKSAIVIKSGVVLLANEYSNMTLLAIHGVPLKTIFTNRAKYTGVLREFKKNETEFNALRYEYQMLLEASGGVSTNESMKVLNRIKVLSERLNSSPVKKLYDEGFLSTIAEDLEQTNDPYSYKNLLGDKVRSVLDRAPKAVGTIAETLYMSENTPLYKFMNDMTQSSDFIARMTLYEHLTTRKHKPLSHEAALHEVSEAFVNYDIPLPKGLQYMDDMMFLPFTKYFLSIQRVIAKNFINRPLSSMAVMFASDYLGLADHVMEPFIGGRIGNNPVWPGIFSGMDAFQDILPIQGIRQLTP